MLYITKIRITGLQLFYYQNFRRHDDDEDARLVQLSDWCGRPRGMVHETIYALARTLGRCANESRGERLQHGAHMANWIVREVGAATYSREVAEHQGVPLAGIGYV